MKFEALKKRSLLESAGILAAVVVMGIVVYLLGSANDSYQASNESLQKDINAIDADTKTLRAKYSNIQQNLDLYMQVKKKQEEGRLAINQQVGLDKFKQFKSRYALSGLHMTVSPVQAVTDGALKRKNSAVNFSDVTMNFDVTSDEAVYRLIDSLHDELPGICKLIRLNLILQKPLNDEALLTLSQKGEYPLVRGEIRFIWYGINTTESVEAKAAGKPAEGKPDAPKP